MESVTPKLFEGIPIVPEQFDFRREWLRARRDVYVEDKQDRRYKGILSAKTYNLEQWLLEQKEGWRWDIVNSKNGCVMGFGEDGKLIFKQIAQKLRSLHHGRYYCGSLFESIRISHDLNVTFSTFPIEAKDDKDLRQGIMIDTLQFRSLVAKMIANEKKESQLQLSKGILLFFSEIFTDRVQSNELQEVKDYSFLQMFHPVFFNSSDRTNFMYLTAQYREINPEAFDENLNLCNKNYGLSSWKLKPSSIIYKCLTRKNGGDQNINNIPKLIRNTLVHFKSSDEGKGCTLEYIENSVNKEFPDICAKLLDCLMRNLNHPPSFGGCKLVDLFEKKPMRLYTRPYGIVERKGG